MFYNREWLVKGGRFRDIWKARFNFDSNDEDNRPLENTCNDISQCILSDSSNPMHRTALPLSINLILGGAKLHNQKASSILQEIYGKVDVAEYDAFRDKFNADPNYEKLSNEEDTEEEDDMLNTNYVKIKIFPENVNIDEDQSSNATCSKNLCKQTSGFLSTNYLEPTITESAVQSMDQETIPIRVYPPSETIYDKMPVKVSEETHFKPIGHSSPIYSHISHKSIIDTEDMGSKTPSNPHSKMSMRRKKTPLERVIIEESGSLKNLSGDFEESQKCELEEKDDENVTNHNVETLSEDHNNHNLEEPDIEYTSQNYLEIEDNGNENFLQVRVTEPTHPINPGSSRSFDKEVNLHGRIAGGNKRSDTESGHQHVPRKKKKNNDDNEDESDNDSQLTDEAPKSEAESEVLSFVFPPYYKTGEMVNCVKVVVSTLGQHTPLMRYMQRQEESDD